MKKEFVRNPYNYDSDELSDDTGLLCKDESRTSQEFMTEQDINYIAEQFMRTGELKQVLNMPTFGDFEGTFDFQSSMNLIAEAKLEFMKLPAKTRARFANDPQELLNFIADDSNYDEAVKLGFIQPKEQANESSSSRSTQAKQKESPGKTGATGAESKNAPAQKPGSKTAESD